MRRFLRLRSSAIIICCLMIVYIALDIKMIKTKLRHPGQFLVKMVTVPRIIIEQPDLLDNDSMNGISGRCPKKPPDINLDGYISIDQTHDAPIPELNQFPAIGPGGSYKPDKCVSRTKNAIIVPYRNRERHLRMFINHIIPFLVRQQADFTIFVIELVPDGTYNKASLLNAGFLEALRTRNFTCIIFHDVDLLPESDSNLYRCGDHPRHMAVSLSAFEYKQPSYLLPGGVLAMKPEMYQAVNGHSNLYFGWGGEDDDFIIRLTRAGFSLYRYPANVSRYTSIYHSQDSGNEVDHLRHQLLWTAEKRMMEEGLNSLKYKRVSFKKLPLYTWILVDVDRADYEEEINKFT